MKKLSYVLLIFAGYSSTGKLYSQTEHKCFSSEVITNGSTEKTFVSMIKSGKNVDLEIIKEMTQGTNSYSRSWEMEGVIEGDKITFNVPQATVDMFKKDVNPIEGPKPIETIILKNDRIIFEEKILKAGNCK